MKLRIYKNSLRFRFTMQEVEALYRGECLEDAFQVGPMDGQRFVYRVAPQPDMPAGLPMSATLNGPNLVVSVAAGSVRSWHDSPDLALTGGQPWEGGELKIHLEKDMQRLNPKPGEDESGVYPNPLSGKVRCDHP